MKCYRLSQEEVKKIFDTNVESGLTTHQVEERLKKYGPNTFPEKHRDTYFEVFLNQFKSPLIYVLLIAAILIFIAGQSLDSFIISGVLLFNSILGTIQEGRTRYILDKLRKYIKSESLVIRNGKEKVISSNNIVPGDLIILEAGNRVPADIRLIECNNLSINEAILTGESDPVVKYSKEITNEARIHDQFNMAFQGTYVIGGYAKGIAIATGNETEIGKINKISREIEEDFPLKREISNISKTVLLLILFFCLALFVIGTLQGRPLQELFTMLTALFICVVPEGLPVALTLILVTGAYKMAKQNVLIKKLQAVETIGRVETIILDKTGTLTRNEMMVCKAYADETFEITGEGYYLRGEVKSEKHSKSAIEKLHEMGIISILLNRSKINFFEHHKRFDIWGEPTEAALYIFGKKLKINETDLAKEYKLLYEIPFDTTNKLHAGFFEHNGKISLFVNGAPEIIGNLSKIKNNNFDELLNKFLASGLRTIAFAKKEIPGTINRNMYISEALDLIKDLEFLGFAGIEDSVRSNVKESIIDAKNSGIQIVMATGDHLSTALYVAEKTSIKTEHGLYITGDEFDKLTDSQKLQNLEKIEVFARFQPAEKFELVNNYHKLKKVVAMTGDGVNDLPSLLAADVGIVMGSMGTEIAKEVADIVLLDDSFFSIMYAIKQGRHIFYSLRRVILYFFATNLGEILVVFYALLMNLPTPILAAQILWLNLITDGFLDIALAMEPEEQELLLKWNFGRKLINKNLILKVIYMAIPMGIGSVLAFYLFINNLDKARTMTLLTMAMFQWFNAWNCRSEYKSILQSGLFKNIWLVLATSFVLFLQILVIYNPILQKIFKTVAIDKEDWLLVFAISASILVFEEIRKVFARHYYRHKIDVVK